MSETHEGSRSSVNKDRLCLRLMKGLGAQLTRTGCV